MFESAYQLTMKHASRILCAVAFFMIAVGIAIAIYGFGHLGPGNEFQDSWLQRLNTISAGVIHAIWPLIGAAAIHRFDNSRRVPEISN